LERVKSSEGLPINLEDTVHPGSDGLARTAPTVEHVNLVGRVVFVGKVSEGDEVEWP